MCGIVGYVGPREAQDIVLEGLRRLEYRGYDSAGLAVADGACVERRRSVGKLENLAAILQERPMHGSLGIGHTRWATHGGVTEANAHPHTDSSGRIVIIQNGIVENYLELKAGLLAEGVQFVSQTDTEVIAHLVAKHYHNGAGDLATAVRLALGQLQGASAVVAMSIDEPGTLVAARLGNAGGVVLGVNPFRRLTPPGTLRSAPGLASVVLSRGMMMFAFYGCDAFIPYAITDAKGSTTFAGSIAVTLSTLGWTGATWIQQRHIVRTGEALFIRYCYLFLTIGVTVIAAGGAIDDAPIWVIHIGALIAWFGVGLGYSAHTQSVLRVASPERYGKVTASLQLTENLGVSLGAGLTGAVVALGDSAGWAPGSGFGTAMIAPIAIAIVGGAFVARRLPPGSASQHSMPAAAPA